MRSRVAVVLIALAAASAGTAATVTPAQTLASALAAARAQHSVHYVAVQSAGSRNVTIAGDAAGDRGIQRVTYRDNGKAGHVTVIVVANTAYVRGDAFTLEHYMGLPAATAAADAGKWLRLAHTSAGFATVAASVRLASTVSELAMPKPLTAVAATTVAGQQVVGVRARFTVSGQKITETLFVRSSGTPLPVEQLSVTGSIAVRVLFSSWNEPVRLAAPAHSVPLS
ncbi:MAG: hypothetical protein ACJ76I_07940 [Gaiellaceae bacterium]